MPPPLLTDRLHLRPPSPADEAEFFQLNTDTRVLRYINGGRPMSKKESTADLQRRLATADKPLGYWVVESKDTGQFYGWAALKQLDQTEKIEIGYRLRYSAWGRGIATETATRVLAYGFEVIQLPCIWGVAMPGNLASRRVLEKIGLQYRGTGRYYNTLCASYCIEASTYFNG